MNSRSPSASGAGTRLLPPHARPGSGHAAKILAILALTALTPSFSSSAWAQRRALATEDRDDGGLVTFDEDEGGVLLPDPGTPRRSKRGSG